MLLRKNAKIELIRSVPLFARCTKKELEAIAAAADEIAVPVGRTLTTEGAVGREFVILVEGAADVLKGGRHINELAAGDFFGEISLLTDGPRTATVVSTSASTLLVLTHHAFKRVTEAVPSVKDSVMRALAERVQRDTV